MDHRFYRSDTEHMVRYEMDQVDRAVEQARLLREAGLTGPGMFTRTRQVLADFFQALRIRRNTLQPRRSIEPKAFPRRRHGSI